MSVDEELRLLIRQEVRAGVTEGLAAARVQGAPAGAGEIPTSFDPEAEVTTAEAAEIAHVRPRTINEWDKKGLLDPIKRGRSKIYRAGDVESVARDRQGPRKVLNLKQKAREIVKGSRRR